MNPVAQVGRGRGRPTTAEYWARRSTWTDGEAAGGGGGTEIHRSMQRVALATQTISLSLTAMDPRAGEFQRKP
jgi:hypothetical protein